MIEFNQQQLDIINSIDTNTMVSASAGAGKTTVLIGRLIKRILKDGISIDQIVAMTFTEKAAAEMKNRLSEALGKELLKSPNDPRLQEQFTLLASAQISTIHSFCLTIIKEFGYLKGFDPKRVTNIFDDQVTKTLKDEAKHYVLNVMLEKYQNDETFQNLLNFFSYKIVDYEGFSEAFMKLAETANSNLDPDAYYQLIKETYHSKTLNDYPRLIQDKFYTYGKIHLKELENQLLKIENSFLESDNQNEVFYNQLLNRQELLRQAQEAFESKDIDKTVELLIEIFSQPLKQVNKVDYSKLNTQFTNTVATEAFDYFYRKQDLTASLPYVELLIEAAQLYAHKFSELKADHQGLDFDDIERFAYELLSLDLVTDALKNRYEEILVDEFQDSNYFQNEIVQLISKGNNVFRVGDVKQSIYGFRNAKPQLMQDIMNLDGSENHKTLYLSKNFRSAYNIVEFNNLLFEKMMNIEGSSLNFTQQDRVEVGLERQKNNQQPVEIKLLNPQQKVDYIGFNKPVMSSAQKIAYYIGQDIQHKVNAHQIDYKDACILIRSHSRKRELKRAFDDLNIPYYIEDREGFYHAYSVQDVTHFLKHCLNPHDNHALTWVLLSGFVNYSENQLAELVLVNPNQSYYENLSSYDPDLKEQLQTLHQQFETGSPQNFIIQLLHFNQYYNQHLNTQERTNLDLFCQRYVLYFNKPNTGTVGFLEQIEHALDIESSNASAISEDDNVVRVYTVHQSKGLEYPLVYFFSNKASNTDQDIKQNISFDSDLGLSMGLLDFKNRFKEPTLFDSVYNTSKQIESIQEEIRNLYVALTRAKQHLIIVDIEQKWDEKEIELTDLINGDNYTKLILKSLHEVESETYTIQEGCIVEPIYPQQTKTSKPTPTSTLVTMLPQPEIQDSSQERTLTLNLQKQFATDYGSSLHQLLEQLPDELWDESMLSELNEDMKQKLLHYNQDSLTQSFYQYPIEHEVAIAYLDQDQLNYGYMDMLITKDDEIIMVDFKTDKVNSEQELILRYQNQMNLYKKGLLKCTPQKAITQYLYSFALGRYILL